MTRAASTQRPRSPLDAIEIEAVDAGRGVVRGRVDGEESLSIHSTDTQPAEIALVHGGQVHRFPVDGRFATKAVHRLWRATRVARAS